MYIANDVYSVVKFSPNFHQVHVVYAYQNYKHEDACGKVNVQVKERKRKINLNIN